MEHWRSAHNSHQLPGQRSHRTMCDKNGNDDRGGLGWGTVAGGTGVTTREDLFKGHSWTTGVALLITVGVGLLSCVCAVFDPHLPTGSVQVTREPEVARQPNGMTLESMRTKIINHGKERTWSLSGYSGDQLWQVWQLMEMLNARYCRATLVQLLRRIAIMSENPAMSSGDDRVWGEFFDWVTGGDDYSYESKLWSHNRIHTQALGEEWTRDDGDVKRVLVKFFTHDWNTELNQQSCIRVAYGGRETRGIGHSRLRWVPIQPSSDWDRHKALSHDGGSSMWSDGGDTVERGATRTMKLRAFVG